MQGPRSVAAVVPTYNPSPSLIANLESLMAQVDAVVVVDDGSATPETDELLGRAETLGAVVLRTCENRGIAHALNVGVEDVRSRLAPDFIITMDQDTHLADDYLATALAAFTSAPAEARLQVVTCESEGELPRPVLREAPWGAVPLDPFQSGMVLRAGVFDEIGPFREDFFIDCVDVEFYLRLLRAGLGVVIAPGCVIDHHLGELHTVRLPGYVRTFSYHQPFRRYYIVRNRLATLRAMAIHEPTWALRVLRGELLSTVKGFLLGPDRRAQWIASWAGVRDFARGRFGRIPDDVAVRLREASSTRN